MAGSIPKNTKLDKDLLFQMMAASVSEDASKASVPAAYPARENMVSEDSSKYAAAANATIVKTMPTPGHPTGAPVTNAIRPVLVQVITGQLDVEAGTRKCRASPKKQSRAVDGRAMAGGLLKAVCRPWPNTADILDTIERK